MNSQNNATDSDRNAELEKAVLGFFLNLYKLQLGIPEEENVDTRIIGIETDLPGSEKTYELHVRSGEIKSRRMSIASLGDSAGSKSKCFKVTYDDLLVVKIPPVPVRDFDEYIRNIETERRIAENLNPEISSIAPSLSAILRKIPKFAVSPDVSTEKAECAYIRALKTHTWPQNYLKIGDAFVFFMNLSKDSFLSQFIDRLHASRYKLFDDIFSQAEIFWNLEAFEGVFGTENDALFFDISEIYSEFEERINLSLRQREIDASILLYKKKQWFMRFLAEMELPAGDMEQKMAENIGLEAIENQIQEAYSAPLESCREIIREYIHDKSFSQNRQVFKKIVSTLLDLLSDLRKKSISIRDLKPDNLFVVGDAERKHADEFELGLIDFETAAFFRKADSEILQPFMAGTPTFATPSHFVPNGLLIKNLGNLKRTLHLQDWHAVTAMIYQTVTGERLFEKTRRWTALAGANLQKTVDRDRESSENFVQYSRYFWYSAVKEFRSKMRSRGSILSSLPITLTDKGRSLLTIELEASCKAIEERIIGLVHGRKDLKCSDSLIRSGAEDVSRLRKNWEEGVSVPRVRQEVRHGIINLLGSLEPLKAAEETRKKQLKKIRSVQNLTSRELLECMFDTVFTAMYLPQWGSLADEAAVEKEMDDILRASDESDAVNADETVAYGSASAPEATI